MPGWKVLICDDEPSLRELMRLALSGDYAFAEASETGEAIQAVQRFRPDIVLLDMLMPGDGLEVLRQLRRDPELGETPVLVVSALSAEPDRRAASEAGATGFLAKPFEPDELRAVVEELLAVGR